MVDGVRSILDRLLAGDLSMDQAEGMLKPAHERLPFATLDHDRAGRCGAPEVVYAAGKSPEQVVVIVERLVERSGFALVTRADEGHQVALDEAFELIEGGHRRTTLLVGTPPTPVTDSAIPIVTAGTSDEPVAEEAMLTCLALGQPTRRMNDVGVAGLSRLFERLDEVRSAKVVICIAGMEGALPSVLGGLVEAPVIAVPTSVGYGAAFGGLAALCGMLTSCASGVAVVNIDNGFGAAYTATLIQRLADGARPPGSGAPLAPDPVAP